jgi:uridine phosphorylase
MDIAEGGPFRLVVAAERREFRGILRNCGPAIALTWPVAVSVAARVNGMRYVFAANGPGPRLAAQVLDAAEVEAGKAGSKALIGAVISTGFCGGLDPRLALGDIVEATSVVDLDTGNQYDARPISTSARRERGAVLSMDRVAVTIEEKARLRSHATGALAVEMEASTVGSWAEAQSIPFYCVRVVSDRACDAFPMDMNQMRDLDGRFDRLRITSQALLKPWTRIPGLLKLDRDCRVAEDKLGEFFANCRFE